MRILICLSLCLGASVLHSQSAEKKAMTTQAAGTFDVKLKPLKLDDETAPPTLGRMSIDKQFHGDLEGASKGEMLTGMTDVKDSAGYVAIERVTGTMRGRRGSFVLQHSATMTRGAQQLSITVVPDSGTEQLSGLMTIQIAADGKHSYVFEYTLPPLP
jgi:predicted flavoprotein YhiN